MTPIQTSEAYNTTSTVTAVETDAGGYIAVSTSCGHPFTYAGLHTPRVGEPLDCMTCHVEALERAEQQP